MSLLIDIVILGDKKDLDKGRRRSQKGRSPRRIWRTRQSIIDRKWVWHLTQVSVSCCIEHWLYNYRSYSDLLLSSRKVSKVSKDFKRKRKFPADTSDKRGTKRQRVSFDMPRRGGAHRPANSNTRATATKRSSGHQTNGRKTTRPSTKRTVYTGTVFRKKSQRT